jgi:hypothetical protein
MPHLHDEDEQPVIIDIVENAIVPYPDLVGAVWTPSYSGRAGIVCQ